MNNLLYILFWCNNNLLYWNSEYWIISFFKLVEGFICSLVHVIIPYIIIYVCLFVFLLYAVVLFRSREHDNCGPQPGCVRAHIESKISFWSDSILQSSREKSIFSRVLNVVNRMGLRRCPLLCFANSCYKGVSSFDFGGLSSLAFFVPWLYLLFSAFEDIVFWPSTPSVCINY